MAGVILVDTSAWITARTIRTLRESLDAEIAVCPPIVQELLQGVRNEEAYRAFQRVLSTVLVLDSPMPLARYEEAGSLYVRCREAAYTIRSGVDCLIATCALTLDVRTITRSG